MHSDVLSSAETERKLNVSADMGPTTKIAKHSKHFLGEYLKSIAHRLANHTVHIVKHFLNYTIHVYKLDRRCVGF
jgi:hypothetical protein